jgi:uncharacterized peroxidase-related enzyme
MSPDRVEPFMDAIEGNARDGAELPAESTQRERAMVLYAIKLTRTPASMERADLDPMRRAGLSDRAILEVNQVVSYFAYANRVADGLGIEIEAYRR